MKSNSDKKAATAAVEKVTAGFIFLIACLVYINTLNNQFTNWDDVDLIINNEMIRSLAWDNIKRIFDVKAGGTYQPLRVLSYAFDYHFWGFSPAGYHIHSILLHAVASMLLYVDLLLLLPLIKGMERYGRVDIFFIAFLTAVVFATHPIGAEAVAWLSGRKYVLLAVFTFLSALFFIQGFRKNKQKWAYFSSALISALAATLSSPFGIVIPFSFLLCLYSWENSVGLFRVLGKYKRFLSVLGLLFLPLFLKLYISLIHIRLVGQLYDISPDRLINYSCTMLRVLFDYIRNIFFPFWLNVRYPDVMSHSILDYKVLIGLCFVIISAVFLFFCLKNRDKRAAFCLGWFFLFLLPVSNIVPISTIMADRYLYISFPGIILLPAIYIFPLLRKAGEQLRISHIVLPGFIVFLTGCYFVPLTIERNLIWRDSGSLWSDSLRRNSNNAIAHNNLGVHLLYFEKKYQEAIHHFEEAARLKPESRNPSENLVNAYFQMGENFSEKSDDENAIKSYQKALEIDPLHTSSINNLGVLLMRRNKLSDAMKLFETSLNLGIEDPTLYYNAGVVYSLSGNAKESAIFFLKVLEIDPGDAIAHFLAGKELLKIGQSEKGWFHIKTAQKLEPGNSKLYLIKEN